jgi:dTMP kinase
VLCYSGTSRHSATTGIPVFITFEGIEGSGKSLQITRAYEYLRNEKGIASLLTREPGATDFGLALRSVLLGIHGYRMEPRSELLLYLADRHQHLKEIIEPALERGLVILSDRYQDATRAYQGTARGIPGTEIEKLSRILGIIEPDKTILLDLDPETGLSRARSRNLASGSTEKEGRFEAEDLEFHRKVRGAYLELAAQAPHRINVVPASGTPDEVSTRIFHLLDRWIASNK